MPRASPLNAEFYTEDDLAILAQLSLAEEFIRTILPGDMDYRLFNSEANQIIKVWEGFSVAKTCGYNNQQGKKPFEIFLYDTSCFLYIRCLHKSLSSWKHWFLCSSFYVNIF